MPTVEAIAPSFFVADLGRSIDWYVRVLGFQIEWTAADHAGVSLGPALIVLVQPDAAHAGVVYRSACHLRLASGVDKYVEQIEGAGQPMAAPAADRPEYGMREAAVRDPDGNDIYIAQELRSSAAPSA
jgi:catechol 2,3-dioxygenase-like lactoylglutathione lyase family enzyme